MKWVLKGLLLGCLTLMGFYFARAEGPVDFVMRPVYSGGTFTSPEPVRIILSNSGDEAIGTLNIGEADDPVTYPFHLKAGEKKSFIANCLVDADDLDGDERKKPCVTVSLIAKSRSFIVSRLTQTLAVNNDRPPTLLLIGDRSSNLGFLNHKDDGGGSTDELYDLRSFNEPIGSCRLSVSDALDRASVYSKFSFVVLGSGSGHLTDANIETLKQYVVDGGRLVFCPSPNSALKDPRWSVFVPASSQFGFLGFGSFVRLSFNPESIAGESPLYRHRFQVEAGQLFFRRSLAPLRSDAFRLFNQDELGIFDAKLPSIYLVALTLLVYFLTAVPINFLLLKRLKRPHLMYLTAPACAVVFAGVIFRESVIMEDTPMSLSAAIGIVSAPEIREDRSLGDYELFLPKAKTTNFNLKGVENLIGYQAGSHDPFRRQVAVTDNGTLNISDFRSLNLTYYEFSDVEAHTRTQKEQFAVHFAIGRRQRGVYPVIATNVGTSTIHDAIMVVGRYKAEFKTIGSGKSVQMIVDQVVPAPLNGYVEYSAKHFQDKLFNVHRAASLCQVQGQVALFGVEHNYRSGPRLGTECQLRSEAVGVAFAPIDLKIPVVRKPISAYRSEISAFQAVIARETAEREQKQKNSDGISSSVNNFEPD